MPSDTEKNLINIRRYHIQTDSVNIRQGFEDEAQSTYKLFVES